ncbi:MAG: KUP/HAK/KT family potassium transporter [Desulfobacterales bacterium]
MQTETQIGQIYVAPVNWMLMVCTISLVAGFQSSSKLAAAYGLAVTSTMIINTVLFFVVIRRQWHWSLMWAAALAGLFLMVDVPFFAANISKIYHGAWFPLVIAETSAMARWRTNLFIFMSRNAADATSFFNLPADQTIEVGVRLEI